MVLTKERDDCKGPDMDFRAGHQNVQEIIWYQRRQTTQQQELPAFRLNCSVHLSEAKKDLCQTDEEHQPSDTLSAPSILIYPMHFLL